MSTEFQWEGHSIQVDSQPAAKYLWLAADTFVKVDGVEIGRSEGFGFTERIIGKFPHNEHSSELALEIKVDLVTLVSVPYKLIIGQKVISQGRLRITNWILFLVPITILNACICGSAIIVLYFMAASNLTK